MSHVSQTPGATTDQRRTNLPLQLTRFIGRESQLATLHELLTSVRLLTLVGAGGVGKTRLALQLAAGLTELEPDGVWLVELAALQDPRLVSQVVAATLDVRPEPNQPPQVTLQKALHDRELLVVLDNCEHLAASCAALASDLLRTCPRLRILAASQEPLGVVGETTWRVPSLTVSDPTASLGADEIGACEAVRLFLDRARLIVPEFTLTDRNAVAIAHICRRLDGIPLAIELAASRINALGPEQILARLDDRFRLLRLDAPEVPERQRTLRATVEWSHDLLTPVERVLFRRLSVFNGGWSLEAAERVCSVGELGSGQVLDLSARLVDRSLVLVERQEVAIRYGLLETLRQYANEKLCEAEEETVLRDQHLEWCVAFAQEAAPMLNTPEQTAWLRALDREYDNVRAALTWSLQSGQIEMALRLAVACGYFWEIRGHRHRAEGLRWLEQATSHTAVESAPASLRAQALYWAGTYASELFQFASAATLLETSFSLWQQIGDTRGVADTLISLGVAARLRGEYDRAASALDMALDLAQKANDHVGTGQGLRQRAALARVMGHLDEADVQSTEALRIFQDLGELHQVGHVEMEVAEVARKRGAFARAAELYAHGMALLGQAGCEEGATSASFLQACLAFDQSNVEEARSRAVDSLQRMQHIGPYLRDTPACLELLAAVTIAEDARKAACLLGAADGLRSAMSTALHAVDREQHQRTLGIARQRLSERGFAEAWSAGRAMSLDEVVAYAAVPASMAPAPPVSQPPRAGLTGRESEVAMLIGRGFSNREIADTLVISGRTAEAHVTHVLNKLGLRSRAQVAVWAVENGLLRDRT